MWRKEVEFAKSTEVTICVRPKHLKMSWSKYDFTEFSTKNLWAFCKWARPFSADIIYTIQMPNYRVGQWTFWSCKYLLFTSFAWVVSENAWFWLSNIAEKRKKKVFARGISLLSIWIEGHELTSAWEISILGFYN